MNTEFLATVLGWYLVIVSLFVLVKHEHAKAVVADVLSQPGLFFIVSLITLILGLLLVTSHNIWVMDWPVLVTLVAWLVLLSGLLRLVCSDTATLLTRSFIDHPHKLKVTGFITLIIGLFLLFHAYYPYIEKYTHVIQ